MLSAAWRALRPKHWIKNLFVLAPMVFAERLGETGVLLRAGAALGLFCVLSSAVYLWNDVADRESDRHHPRKRNRPVASGALPVRVAVALGVSLGGAGLAGSLALGRPFTGVAAAYVAMNLAYSAGLKRIVIVDVMVVATGFVLRAWAGALAVDVEVSHWLVLCSFVVALFLGFVKRRQEIAMLQGDSRSRPALEGYSVEFLDQAIPVVTASTVLAYSLYALSPEVAAKLGTPYMGLTIPPVLFGIFRYLFLVHRRGEGDNPTEVVLADRPLQATVLLWAGLVLLLLRASS